MNNKCKYQITLKNFPYNCCSAQKYCSPVLCPHNYLECPVYSQEYNTNTSAEHSIMNDDIVRTIEKSIESRNKDA